MISGARLSRSPVRNSQARTRLPTLSGVIWLSGENRDPPRSPPQCSQAEAGSKTRTKAQKMATKEMNRRTGFRILPPQAQRNACGIDDPNGTSVSTPLAAIVTATAAAAKPAETNSNADADRRSRWLVHFARRRIVVHHARGRTANDHDVIIRLRPARLAIGLLLRRIRFDAADRGIDLHRLRSRRRRLQVAGTGRPGQRNVLRQGRVGGGNCRHEFGTV